MRNLSYVGICLVFVFLISMCPSFTAEVQSNMGSEPEVADSNSLSLVSHDYIWIDNDADFSAQATSEGWPGDGTKGNPYIIEGYMITDDFSSITIYPTSVYFIIRGCVLTGLGHWGIRLNGVAHGIIEDCSIYGKDNDGMYISYATDVLITDCLVYSNEDNGVLIRDSSGVAVEDSSIWSCGHYGIWSDRSQNVTVMNNNVQLVGGDGVHVTGTVTEINILNNQISSCSLAGIHLESPSKLKLINNTISDCTEEGIDSTSCSDLVIANNSIATVSGHGIYLLRNSQCIVENNSIESDDNNDLYLYDSVDCSVHHNMFYSEGLFVTGSSIEYWLNDISENTVRGMDVGYFLNRANEMIDGAAYGQVFLVNCDKVTISGGVFSNSAIAAAVAFSRNCSLKNMQVSGSGYGIYVYCSENCSFADLIIDSGGITILGSSLSEWLHLYSNILVNNRPLAAITSQSELTLDISAYGQVIMSNCSGITLENGRINGTSMAVAIVYSNSCILRDSFISNTTYSASYVWKCHDCQIVNFTSVLGEQYGVSLYYSYNCTVSNSSSAEFERYGFLFSYCNSSRLTRSNSSSCDEGVYAYHSENITVDSAYFWMNTNGILAWSAHGLVVSNTHSLNSTTYGLEAISTDYMQLLSSLFENASSIGGYITGYCGNITGCVFRNNGDDGLGIWGGGNFTITSCKFIANSYRGLYLHYLVQYCKVYLNEFADNDYVNAYCYSKPNQWDDGVSMGNRWDDNFSPDPYLVPGPAGVYDNYPILSTSVENKPDTGYHIGTTGHVITWQGYAASPDSYIIYFDEAPLIEADWDGSDMSVSIDGLDLGTYNYTIYVNDTLGFHDVDTVLVTVYDSPPSITPPEDMYIEYLSTGNVLRWYASDMNPDSYVVYKDNSKYAEGVWSGYYVDVNVDALSTGTHNYTLIVNDTRGQLATDTVLVFVIDYSPQIDAPADIEYVVGSTGNTLTWNPSDTNPLSYELYRNSTLIDSDNWSSESLSFNVDGLDVGYYNYTLIVYDTSGNLSWNTVFVTVIARTSSTTTTSSSSTTGTSSTTENSTSSSETDSFGMLQIVSITVTLASVVSIVIVVILIVRRRSYTGT